MGKKILLGSMLILVLLLLMPSITAIHQMIIGEEKIQVNLNYLTIDGNNKVESQVLKEDLNHLFALMDESNYDGIVYELDRLNLLPSCLDTEKVKHLISGEYGKKHYSNILEKIEQLNIRDSDENQNIFCFVNGNAVDNVMRSLGYKIVITPLVDITLLLWALDEYFISRGGPFYPVFNVGLDSFGIFFIIGLIPALISDIINRIFVTNPLKITGYSYAYLEDTTSPPYTYANVNTTGLLGRWHMHNKYIFLSMVGFCGLWINYNDGVNKPACKFMGFALYVKAQGENE